MHEQTFAYLIFGLAKYLDSNATYPLPDELRFALNQLAYAQRANYPRTFNGVLQMLTHPLRDWWPSPLPVFDPEASLIYEGDLSITANEYLDELFWFADLPVGVSTEGFQLALDKLSFKRMLNELRAKAVDDPETVQQEYVALRRFLILRPWPTTQEIIEELGGMQYIQLDAVGELYSFAETMQARYLYDGSYWNCPQCGPLIVYRSGLGSVKPNSCGAACPRYLDGWGAIRPQRQLRVLKRAHHLSILIPGIPELELFSWLEDLHSMPSSNLVGVELWPGLDAYDLRVVFNDGEAWAVDVKDYTDPTRLEAVLTRPPENEAIAWSRAFYVFPTHRLEQRNRYRETVARLQRKLPREIDLMDKVSFQHVVMNRLGGRHV